MRQKLDAFQNSRAGHFLKKVMDDRAPNLAVLLAWGTLNTLGIGGTRPGCVTADSG
jgi:hypothetical protein